MEKLVWFKFSPRDWVMGKIQRCPEVTQARFVRLMCMYWNKECEMTLEDAEIEIDKEHLDILISKKVILVENDFIKIKFLDENFEKSEGKTNKLSTSGKIGNLKKHNPDLYERFKNQDITLDEALELQKNKVATLSPPESHPIATQSHFVAEKRREEERREEKIKEDKNINSHSPINWESFLKFYNDTFGKKTRLINDTNKKRFLKLLKDGYTKEDILKAMITVKNDKWAKDKEYGYCSHLYFTRPDVIERYAFPSKIKNNTNNYNGTL